MIVCFSTKTTTAFQNSFRTTQTNNNNFLGTQIQKILKNNNIAIT